MRLNLLLLLFLCSIHAAPVTKDISFSDLLSFNSTSFLDEMEQLDAEAQALENYKQKVATWIVIAVVVMIILLCSGVCCCVQYYGDIYVYVYFNSAMFRNFLLRKRVWTETRKQRKIIQENARASRYGANTDTNVPTDSTQVV